MHSTALIPRASIGVFDSGVGGLSVLQALRAELPHENFIYVADSGHAPYGERDEAHVVSRSLAIANYLVSQNVKALVVACNTATAAAVATLRAHHPDLPLIGVEPALKPAVALSKTGCIGVMATRNTLASAKFQLLLSAQAKHAAFTVQACDGLADAIERSAEDGDTTKTIALCLEFTRAMGVFGQKKGQMDTLILGCTHYPFASTHLEALLGPHVQLISTGEAVARQTRRLVDLSSCLTPGEISLLTTGQVSRLQAAAGRWLGLRVPVRSLCL